MSVVTDIITDWHDYDFLILSLIFLIQNINRWCIPLSDLFPLMKVAQIGLKISELTWYLSVNSVNPKTDLGHIQLWCLIAM